MKKLFKNLLLFVSLIASNNIIQAQISGPSSICFDGNLNSYINVQNSATYEWSVSPNSGVSTSDTTLQYLDVFFPAAGNYTVTVYTSGPIDTFSVAVSLYTTLPSPIASDVTYCQGDNVLPLTAVAQSGGVIDWYADAGATTLIPTPTPTNSSTYYVMETLNGCQSSLVPVYATFNSLPVANAGSNSPVCEGQNIELTSTGGMQYSWAGPAGYSAGVQNPSIVNPPIAFSGTFTVTAIDVNGCFGTATTNVIITPGTNISGTVYLNATPIASGKIYLYTPPPTGNMYYCIDTVNVNASGQYLFSSVTSGNYLVKCVPDIFLYPSAISTYYGNAAQWDSSIVINHDCVNDFVADINLLEPAMMVGPGFVSGSVLEGAGFGSKMINSVNEVMIPGGPLKDITVNLIRISSGQVNAQSISDSTGYFEFANVPIGDYTLQVDIPGLTMDSSYFIAIDGNFFVSGVNSTTSSLFTNLDFMADDQAIFMTNAIGINELKNKTEEFSIYPNPAKNSITIKAIGFDSKDCEIELINTQGQSIFIDKQISASDHTLDLKKLNIASGLYVVKLSSANVIKTTKLIVE